MLAGRRGAEAPGATDLRDELAARGVDVTLAACDAADRDALTALIEGLPADQPLDAVFHAAGSLDDGVIDSLTPERMTGVLRGKATAARVLHELTRDLDLSAFVLFSSTAGVLGGAGLGNYAPGNAYLDALAAERRAAGLPATAVSWGLWADGGMVGDAAGERMRRHGVHPMDTATACQALGRALDLGDTHVVVTDLRWDTYAPSFTAPRPSALLDELPAARRALTPPAPARRPTQPPRSRRCPPTSAPCPRTRGRTPSWTSCAGTSPASSATPPPPTSTPPGPSPTWASTRSPRSNCATA